MIGYDLGMVKQPVKYTDTNFTHAKNLNKKYPKEIHKSVPAVHATSDSNRAINQQNILRNHALNLCHQLPSQPRDLSESPIQNNPEPNRISARLLARSSALNASSISDRCAEETVEKRGKVR